MGKIKIQIKGTEIDFSKQRGYFLNLDCMAAMKEMPDKSVDLAIVDPVYGDVTKGGYMQGQGGEHAARRKDYHFGLWSQQRTGSDYFSELLRVSKNQIVWGGNYFCDNLPTSHGWVVWDKQHPETIKYADCELAWTSFNVATRMFRFMWNGMLQGDMKNKENRIHPTQKPVILYKWLLNKYANKGDVILDTHVGSASSLIACEQLGYNYIGFEIDEVYYRKAKERLEHETAQITIFDFMESNEIAGQMRLEGL